MTVEVTLTVSLSDSSVINQQDREYVFFLEQGISYRSLTLGFEKISFLKYFILHHFPQNLSRLLID